MDPLNFCLQKGWVCILISTMTKISYTAKTDDWKLFLEIKCNSVEQTRKIYQTNEKQKICKFTKVQSDKS